LHEEEEDLAEDVVIENVVLDLLELAVEVGLDEIVVVVVCTARLFWPLHAFLVSGNTSANPREDSRLKVDLRGDSDSRWCHIHGLHNDLRDSGSHLHSTNPL